MPLTVPVTPGPLAVLTDQGHCTFPTGSMPRLPMPAARASTKDKESVNPVSRRL